MSAPVTASRTIGPLSDWTPVGSESVIEESVGTLLARRLPEIADRPAVFWPAGDVGGNGQDRQDGEDGEDGEDGDPSLAWLSFGELAQRADRLARALVASGVRGERVAVWGRNCVEYVVAEYAVALAGGVLAPFTTMWTDAEVTHALALTRPALLIAGTHVTGDPLLPRATALAGSARAVSLAEVERWAEEVPGAAAAQLPEVAPSEPLLIQFTSGTTGRAKGAVITHRGALNGALQRNLHDAEPPDDLWLNPVPYFHIGGSCFVVLGGLLSGGAFLVMERWAPGEALRLVRTGRVTRLGGVPTMLVDILDGLGSAAAEAGIASVSLGGATVEQRLVDRIRADLRAPTLISYGQSECPLITSTSIGDDPGRIGGTVGRPLPGAHVRIVDPSTGEICPLGVAGEIEVRSPNVMAGYWEMPEATASVMTPDGFLRTGDLGEMDENGWITFRGRSRDVIVRGGENVYPAEVEEVLLDHPDVVGAVLVGVDDDRLGERVAAVVVRRPGSEVTGEALAASLREKVARFKVPTEWRFVDGFPMTASGKIRRFVVREETNAAVGRRPEGRPAPEPSAP